jgi:hypothetical protein
LKHKRRHPIRSRHRRGILQPLSAEQFALLLELGLVDLALGEAFIKDIEGGAAVAGGVATGAPTMDMVEAVAIKRIATGRQRTSHTKMTIMPMMASSTKIGPTIMKGCQPHPGPPHIM